jgi:CHAD domain-containing protein
MPESAVFNLSGQEDAGRVLASLESSFPILREAAPARQRVYLDTFDRRLQRAGMSLSCCAHNGVSTLLLESTEGRVECRLANGALPAFGADFPPGPLQSRVAPIIQVRRLLPLATVESVGEAVSVLDEREKTVARVLTEHSTVAAAGTEAASAEPVQTLRVVPVRGYAGAMRRVRDHIEAELGQKPTPGLAHARTLPPTPPPGGTSPGKFSPPIVPDQSAGGALGIVCRRLLDAIVSNEDGVRRDLDVEFLHDFRVAIRCTRSVLAQFKKVFPADRQAHFRAEFKWLATATSELRDMDVYLQKIDAYCAGFPQIAAKDLAPLEKYLQRQRAAARRRLLGVLRSRRYRRLLEEWREFIDGELAASPAMKVAMQPVAEVASRRIWRAYRQIKRHGARIRENTPADALHELRIDGKKLRYLLTFFAELYDRKDIKPLQKSLKRLQDNLGDFNDLAVQQQILQSFAREMQAEGLASANCLLSMGRLLEHLLEEQGRERQRFADCFQHFSSAENAKRFRRLFHAKGSRRESLPA